MDIVQLALVSSPWISYDQTFQTSSLPDLAHLIAFSCALFCSQGNSLDPNCLNLTFASFILTWCEDLRRQFDQISQNASIQHYCQWMTWIPKVHTNFIQDLSKVSAIDLLSPYNPISFYLNAGI